MRPLKTGFVYLASALLALPAAGEVTIDANTFGGLTARAIGPAVMSGRIAAIDAVGKDPLTVFIGAATGGVWKSTDGGITFRPVFDEHTQSIGALAIDPNDSKTVWVGTGESWVRNSVSVGTGLYKTTDGGETWKRMGLADSERIARIWVNPKDSKNVFACATGHLWNDHEERGVYKSKDGGETWKRVLYVDAKTGCSDLAGDPQDPQILYAGMWQFRRSPDFFVSGGPGSALYRSLDGGETWSKLTQGLPDGEKGRIAVAVAPSRPNVVYVTIEADETALYRSDDLGASFRKMSTSFNIKVRPFYFSRLVVDPQDHNRLYKPGYSLSVSEDGGKTFGGGGIGFGGSVHPDHHALWVNPSNPYEVLLGTDGGVYHSYDRASHWRFLATLPVSQFYHVSVDDLFPYNVYGGLQDNGSWMGPSSSPGGIENRDWDNVGGGDGFWVHRDPANPNFVYSNSQGGNIIRLDLTTREARDIKPQPGKDEPDYRYNWNSPIHPSPNEKGTIYVGAQFLFRTRDHGESWEKISPDLTTNDPALQRQKKSGGLTRDVTSAENATTIYSISESPKNGNVIWVGTDDGNLQLTRDGGKTWTNLVANVPGVPARTWVSSVTADPRDEAGAFVTFDGHRTGDMTTYAYRTRDFGQTWERTAAEGVDGYAWVFKPDLVDPDLLFLGTEFGLYISIDGGKAWARFTGNLPKVAVHDVVVHPRENDLVIATHGRGVYIIDDLTPLRQLSQEIVESEVALLPAQPFAMQTASFLQSFGADDQFVGQNPPDAVSLTYYLKKRHMFGDLKLEVYDQAGKLITTIPGTKRRGLNQVVWPMRLPAPKIPPASGLAFAFFGPKVPEGEYTVKLIKGDQTLTGSVQLVADPRSPHSEADRRLQQQKAMELYQGLEELSYLVESAIAVRDKARDAAKGMAKGDKLTKSLEDLAKKYDDYQRGLVASEESTMFIPSEEKLREKLSELFSALVFYEGRPTQTQLDRTASLMAQLSDARSAHEALAAADLARVNDALKKKGVDPISLQSREEWTSSKTSGKSGAPSPVLRPGKASDLFSNLFRAVVAAL